jgi:hypothetical protein
MYLYAASTNLTLIYFMLTIPKILGTLDNCDEIEPFNFINLGHPYVYLIDSRINVFRNNSDKWAIVSEILGYNNRGCGYAVTLELRYFGNCLKNLDIENNKFLNYYNVLPVDWNNFNETIDNGVLKPDAKFWIVRGTQIALSHNKQDYIDAGIELKEYEPNKVTGEEVARCITPKHRNLFRATDDELYRSLPNDLDKILVIDEWYHKEFHQSKSPFEKPEMLSRFDLNNPSVKEMVDQELNKSREWNLEQWSNRPSNYETWQQIAKVISTGDTSYYRPTLEPNSHWKNWPAGGAM